MDDRHVDLKVRYAVNPVAGLPQRGLFNAAVAKISNNPSGTPGFLPSRQCYQGPKHVLEYLARNDDAKLAAIINRGRFAVAPHQSLVQVRNVKDWWESLPQSRLGLSPNPFRAHSK